MGTQLYNAVIRNDDGNIIGRTNITNWSRICHTTCLSVTYGGKEVFRFPSEKICSSVLSSSSKPVSIVRTGRLYRSIRHGSMRVHIKALSGRIWDLYVDPFTTIEEMKARIEEIEGIPVYQQRYIFDGQQLDDEKSASDYNIQQDSTIFMVLRLRGGWEDGFCMQNIEGVHVTESGNPDTPGKPWTAFSEGLNVVGFCSNHACPSNQQGYHKEKVYFQFGLGEVTINPNNFNKFTCPACKEFGKFVPNNFLICGAQSEFRFRKTGNYQMVRDKTVESGPFPSYFTFNDAEGNMIEYDFIEVVTARLDQSLFTCIDCDKRIERRQDEKQLGCGHYFHKDCAETLNNECVLCRLQVQTEETFFGDM